MAHDALNPLLLPADAPHVVRPAGFLSWLGACGVVVSGGGGVTPPIPPVVPSGVIWEMPRRQRGRLEADVGIVVGADSPMRLRRSPRLRRHRLPADAAIVVGADGRMRAVDYIGAVVAPDDDELLLLLGGRR